jgi:hypothetical protein
MIFSFFKEQMELDATERLSRKLHPKVRIGLLAAAMLGWASVLDSQERPAVV